MGLERRGCVVQPWPLANRKREEPVDEAKPFKIPKREVWEAFKRVKANRGAAGVDGQSIAEFEANLSGNLYKLWNRLSSGSYFPPPVRALMAAYGVTFDLFYFNDVLGNVNGGLRRGFIDQGSVRRDFFRCRVFA